MNLRRMVLATSGPVSSGPSAPTLRTRLCAIEASTAQATLALESPDGQCSCPEPSFRSRITSSTTAVGVESDGLSLAIGDEGVVAIGGKERGPGVVQFRAAHDETVTGVDGVADPGLTVYRVDDGYPGVLGDLLEDPFDGRVLSDSDRVAHLMVTTSLDHVLGEETRVAAQRQRPRRPGATTTAHHLAHEALGAALGVGRTFSKSHVQGLAGVGTGGSSGW